MPSAKQNPAASEASRVTSKFHGKMHLADITSTQTNPLDIRVPKIYNARTSLAHPRNVSQYTSSGNKLILIT
jgi:hypothetical protein